jgi:hypothetical protein
MTDLVTERLPMLRNQRLPELALGNEFLYPDYAGNSILNVPATICRWFDAPQIGAPALDEKISAVFGSDVQRVVLVLMDALALHRFLRWIDEGAAPVWGSLLKDGVLAPLTSIVPSTTCAALTSLWTGRSAYEHGIMGYEMWMKEYGMIVNMITHAPASFNGSTGSLAKAGFQPTAYLPFPTIAQHLAKQGIETHAFLHFTIAHSGLSQMIMNGAEMHAFGSTADLWIGVRRLLESRRNRRLYNWVYWGDVDHLGHLYGPDDERPASDFSAFSQAFERFFLAKLDSQVRKGTVVVLMADHGMLNTPPDPFFEFSNHPSLNRRLHMVPTGENRLMYLYARPGQTEAVREYIDRTWMGNFKVFDAPNVAESGLFGSGERHPALGDRLGDLVVFPTGSMYLWWASKANFLHGRHGGLHPEEMLVPFLAARLG